MKLAEALVLRADCQKRIAQLRQRLARVVKVQEGEKPAEDPADLLTELERSLQELTGWIRAINKTNAFTAFDDKRSIADALAERDELMQRRRLLAEVLENASIRQERFSRSEVKFHRTVDVAAIQKEVDALSKAFREFDFRIQQLNWTVELAGE
ncbi:DIP1984 family protein [Paenibacillus glufosinatiresistens]|uniref:DIP1984 family protein n=1 Tax=Paenibacillus glufosinatiresistens TaxID=3070657 RepID=UPI00286E3256|nr:DIP1984 family protein [Paenibacillus sp. YX.27]